MGHPHLSWWYRLHPIRNEASNGWVPCISPDRLRFNETAWLEVCYVFSSRFEDRCSFTVAGARSVDYGCADAGVGDWRECGHLQRGARGVAAASGESR